jgi:cell division protein FtsZ
MERTRHVPGSVKIKVVGVGGGGCNAITRMVHEHIRGFDFIAMNTDVQHLAVTEAPVRITLGRRLTGGLGAGGDPSVGKRCAEEAREEIKQSLGAADMVFLAAGTGGGTGTGAALVVAEVAKQSGALTIAIVTKPFTFEGNRRMQVAEEGIGQLASNVDTLIVVPNDRLLKSNDPKTGVDSAFKFADEMLCHAVQAIVEMITVPGLISTDFASIKTVMKDSGPAWMSIGSGSGQGRATRAAKEALVSSLLHLSISGAKKVLFNVTGGSDLSLFEVSNAAKVIQQAVDPEANITFGVIIDPNVGDEVRLTLIATGFGPKELSNRSQRYNGVGDLGAGEKGVSGNRLPY